MTDKTPQLSVKKHFGKLIKATPKRRQFDAVCANYQGNRNLDDLLIAKFSRRLQDVLENDGANHSVGSEPEKAMVLFLSRYEAKLHKGQTDAANMDADIREEERRFVSKFLLDRSVGDFQNVSDVEAKGRYSIDHKQIVCEELEMANDQLKRQLDRFYEWSETAEYRRFISNYNCLRHKMQRVDKKDAKKKSAFAAYSVS